MSHPQFRTYIELSNKQKKLKRQITELGQQFKQCYTDLCRNLSDFDGKTLTVPVEGVVYEVSVKGKPVERAMNQEEKFAEFSEILREVKKDESQLDDDVEAELFNRMRCKVGVCDDDGKELVKWVVSYKMAKLIDA